MVVGIYVPIEDKSNFFEYFIDELISWKLVSTWWMEWSNFADLTEHQIKG